MWFNLRCVGRPVDRSRVPLAGHDTAHISKYGGQLFRIPRDALSGRPNFSSTCRTLTPRTKQCRPVNLDQIESMFSTFADFSRMIIYRNVFSLSLFFFWGWWPITIFEARLRKMNWIQNQADFVKNDTGISFREFNAPKIHAAVTGPKRLSSCV